MFNWRSKTPNPVDPAALQEMDDLLVSLNRFHDTSRRALIEGFCAGQDILDIGAGEHDPAFFGENWEHGLICKVAKSAVAIDLEQRLCDHYNEKGFDFRCVDATSDVDLGLRVDTVFIGDVIEHVHEPIGLIKFAARHLKDTGGKIIITTPNPFADAHRRIRKKMGFNFVMTNLEHVSWITPQNMHELALRAGVELTALHWPYLKRPAKGMKGRLTLANRHLRARLSPVESMWAEYIYEIRPQKPSS